MQGGIGHIEVEELWQRLADEPDAVLIDVRTRAEWTFVGVPDLSSLGKQPLLVEWQGFPGGAPNADFATQLSSELEKLGAGATAPLFFICRSGSRSLGAAQAMASAGYRACFNVESGFEGPPDANRHRGVVAGWKAAGLPWHQG
ncbi:MAG: rhodanese-like domain-containing protein [Pseudomonadota bacterium]|nr:rhodanese-like domain-containing protein [Pseudomonadota bacterium]